MAGVVAAPAVTLLVTVLALVADRASAARILGVFPHQGYSHHLVFLPYLRTLADRGHDVYVISNFASAHPRITDLDVRGAKPLPLPNNNVPFANAATRFGFVDTVKCMFDLYHMARATEGMFDAPDVRRLLDDRFATFDLVIAEHFNSDLPLGFAAKYRVPSVLLSSCSLLPWTMSLVGQPLHVAYKPNMLSGLSARMNLGQRLTNAVTTFVSFALFRNLVQSRCRRVLQERLGVDVYTANVSMVLVNTHWTLGGPSSTVPAVREVGGMHILPPKNLPTVSIDL